MLASLAMISELIPNLLGHPVLVTNDTDQNDCDWRFQDIFKPFLIAKGEKSIFLLFIYFPLLVFAGISQSDLAWLHAIKSKTFYLVFYIIWTPFTDR